MEPKKRNLASLMALAGTNYVPLVPVLKLFGLPSE
jgi:hypothetical protein